MASLLIVEDEKHVQDIISSYLKSRGHICYTADDGIEALSIVKNHSIELIVLDIMIPHLNGFEVCKLARKLSDVPIIILTAKDSEEDKIRGYELGADDYMTKPFSIKVLNAKINALLRRRTFSEPSPLLNAGIIQVNTAAREVFVNNQQLDLTHKEYELLLLFINHPGMVFSRERLLEKIWKYEYDVNTRTIDTHIKTLRHKLGDASSYIVTLVRSGYKFEVRN